MLNKVAKYIEQHALMPKDKVHLVALSGGADSVALLRILLQLDYRLEAVHCNFHLRGEESNRDEAFVQQLCQRLGVELHLIHFDTNAYAKLHQVSIEMAARELRYRYFEQLREDIGAATICVAHHRDDLAETVLMNLLRGTGIHGMVGIRPKNGFVVRPLLCVSRQEIEDYLKQLGQEYVTDSTNLEDNAIRNKVRLHLVPMLQTINPKALENIERTAQNMVEVEKIYNSHIYEASNRLLKTTEDCLDPAHEIARVAIADLLHLPSPESVLHELLCQWGFNGEQSREVFRCIESQRNGRVFHSATHALVVAASELFIETNTPLPQPLRVPEAGRYRLNEKTLLSVDLSEQTEVSVAPFCATLDAETVCFPLTLRTIEEGDRFCPYGMKGTKLISDFLTDLKQNVLERRRQLVVADAGGHILWVVGQRTDNHYKISPNTKQVLRLRIDF